MLSNTDITQQMDKSYTINLKFNVVLDITYIIYLLSKSSTSAEEELLILNVILHDKIELVDLIIKRTPEQIINVLIESNSMFSLRSC